MRMDAINDGEAIMSEGKKCSTCKKIFTENLELHFSKSWLRKDKLASVRKPCVETTRKKRVEAQRKANEYKPRGCR